MSDFKEIEIEKFETYLFARPQCSRLDEQHTADMLKKVQEAAALSPELSVLMDMSEVHFLPSLSIGALVTIMHELKQRQQRLILVGLQPEVSQTLAMCRLDKIFEIYDTVETADQRIRQST